MKCIVEVKQAVGDVREGISNGKPWKMASQQCAITMPGADFPVPGKREIFIPKDRHTGIIGEPEWMKPGRYEVAVVVKPDKFGTLLPMFDWRHMTLLPSLDVLAAPRKAA